MDGIIASARAGMVERPGGEEMSNEKVRICVAGVGGGGCNTIHRLSNMGIKSADTIAVNTDALHLKMVNAGKKVLIGQQLTRGLGAGGFPEVAEKCANASKQQLRETLDGCELLFLCAGMGGGTGTGASSVIAEVAKENGTIVIGVVTYPFALERARALKADWGIDRLREVADTVVIVDNNRLVSFVPNLPMNKAFQVADEITARAVKGIADTITLPSLMNIDFADIRTIMSDAGVAMISMGEASGGNRIDKVVENTLKHPLLDVDYHGATGALIHISGGSGLTLGDATQIGEKITNEFDNEANIIWGARLDERMGDGVAVTAILTGLTSQYITGREQKNNEKLTQRTSLKQVESVQYL